MQFALDSSAIIKSTQIKRGSSNHFHPSLQINLSFMCEMTAALRNELPEEAAPRLVPKDQEAAGLHLESLLISNFNLSLEAL